MNTSPKKLPIGIQTFSEIRENNHYYVDKTQKILELIQTSKYIFLSRPRRFGKSLTLDTIAELFSANKELFTGLYAEQHWDWGNKYPVIRINLNDGVIDSQEKLHEMVASQLEYTQQKYGITTHERQFIANILKETIQSLVEKYQQKVVILIDEYDKPILDNLENNEIALQMRDGLRDLYSVIKGQDANIRFAMLTGVSKFSKINLFSGLNNLFDITLNKQFSALCGYTQQELETVFATELQSVDLAEVKRWYNGYNWGGESVYNPFDILLFLQNPDKVFKPYWIETGNATFLIDKLVNEQVSVAKIKNEMADEMLLSAFEVGDISPIALMFQTGYLTLHQVEQSIGMMIYTLKFPNMEVQQSLNQMLLNSYLNKINPTPTRLHLYRALTEHNLARMQEIVKAFFASIPHDWHRNNPIANYEGYWASVFYSLFASLGFEIITEDTTNVGNIDMTLLVDNHVYIFEFKVIEQEKTGKALQQILDKNYADKYRTNDRVIHQIGVEFNKYSREVNFSIQ